MKKTYFFLACVFAMSGMGLCAFAQQRNAKEVLPDLTQWRRKEYDEEFFRGDVASGRKALDYWMQSANYRQNPTGKPGAYSRFERLLKGSAEQIEAVNREVQAECLKAVAKAEAGFNPPPRQPIIWIELALRAPERLTSKTHEVIRESLKALDIAGEKSYYMSWMGTPGSNGANLHAYLTPLVLAPALIKDPKIFAAGQKGLTSELNHMNTTGDMAEFNLLESHWNGTASWEILKQFIPDVHLKRMAEMIAERLWINRFLTWSPTVERITGPGSRMAPSEWLGADNERALFATGVSKPIWLNFFFPWDGWNPRLVKQNWEQTQLEATVPNLPSYLQDIAWRKTFPNELQAIVALRHSKAYPSLKGITSGNPMRPAKYVNYQTDNYTLGSTTSSWVVNTCVLPASAWWNNSRNPQAPLGSPERFCVLYPHYVFNGMSFLDKGEMYFENAPDRVVADSKGGPAGPWMREFIDFGRVGTLQDRNTLLVSYTPKPQTHHKGQELVKGKSPRASAAMFLFRWTEGVDGLFVNRKPVKSLPYELRPGDWWFVEDGDVYAAVRPLAATCLKGNCKIVLKKRKRHIVLYLDNVNSSDIIGISDEDWVKSQSGFIVEMGNKKEYGSFSQFQNRILAGKVIQDEKQDFNRIVLYDREGRQLEMDWNCYTEEYAKREIGGKPDPWPKFLTSPEFSVGNSGEIKVYDAVVKTKFGESLWILSARASNSWVVYQPNPNKLLPIDFESPGGRIKTENFPFGKIIVHKSDSQTLQIDIDASYQRDGKLPEPFRIITSQEVKLISLKVNGLMRTLRASRRGTEVEWSVDLAGY